MSKVAVVYWSGTGNTEIMAQKVLEGAKAAGAEAALFTAGEFSADKMDDFDAVAFGCPAMGAEQLEEGEFEPMFNACESKLSGKKIALFGSYDWGDGAVMACDFVICHETPDAEAEAACIALGKALA